MASPKPLLLLLLPLTSGCASLIEGNVPMLRFASSSARIAAPPSIVASREPIAASYALAPRAAASDRGEGIDVDRENQLAADRLSRLTDAEVDLPTQLIVVPGFATRRQAEPLHPRAQQRLDLAIEALDATGALAILVSGGNVHPTATPFNEALEMKRYLLGRGVPEDRIVIEPYARHSTTNLRNAGRFMLAFDLQRALVVTTRAQAFYFRWPYMTSFHFRCLSELGYRVGSLSTDDTPFVRFEPSPSVFARGPDPLDP